MLRLRSILLFAACTTLVCADLKSDLSMAGIQAVFPGEPDYDHASVSLNRRIQYKPAAVVYPASAKEVSEAVKIGVKNDVKIAPRSGGHSYIENGLGGRNGSLVIDMMYINHIGVNTSTNVAIIGAGNRLGAVVSALDSVKRATVHGTWLYIGIGGHITYGGYGFTSRMWGLATDNVISMDVVLANGTVVTASNDQNADLFWAMRGAGGSFGIATSILFNVYPEPPSVTTFIYNWTLGIEAATEGLGAYQSFAESNLSSYLGARVDFYKGSARGNVTFIFKGAWYGQPERFADVVAPFLDQMPPQNNVKINNGSYTDSAIFFGNIGSLNISNPQPINNLYAKSLLTPQSDPMSLVAIRAFIEVLAYEGYDAPINWLVDVDMIGGTNSAVNTIPHDATAYPHRSSTLLIQSAAEPINLSDPFPQEGFDFVEHSIGNITSNMPQDWHYGAFINFVDDKLPNWQNLYYDSHYSRLQELKARYDAAGVFGAFKTGIEEPS